MTLSVAKVVWACKKIFFSVQFPQRIVGRERRSEAIVVRGAVKRSE